MMYAYDKVLFPKAQLSLASMFEYAVGVCARELEGYYYQFLSSPLSRKFERGDSNTIAGMSGIELAREVMSDDTEIAFPEPIFPIRRSQEFWLGWSLAHYQWENNIPFRKITENITISSIYDMYPKYHEMDYGHFANRVDEMRKENRLESSLKRIRMYAGLSQRELASLTEIPVRTIQQYEQGQKSINKAQVDYLVRLSNVLSCRIEDLL